MRRPFPRGSRGPGLFAGLLKCADCGRAMVKTRWNNVIRYSCGSYRRYGSSICTKHYITQKDIEAVILRDLNRIIGSVRDLKAQSAKRMLRRNSPGPRSCSASEGWLSWTGPRSLRPSRRSVSLRIKSSRSPISSQTRYTRCLNPNFPVHVKKLPQELDVLRQLWLFDRFTDCCIDTRTVGYGLDWGLPGPVQAVPVPR